MPADIRAIVERLYMPIKERHDYIRIFKEKEADEKLTQIAESVVNPAAMESRSDEEYEEEERGFFQSD